MPSPDSILNVPYVESLYEQFTRDRASVPDDWRAYFEQWGGDVEAAGAPSAPAPAPGTGPGTGPAGNGFRTGPSFRRSSFFAGNGRAGGGAIHPPADASSAQIATLQHKVDQLIRNYRVRGHRIAQIDPLGMPRLGISELDPAFYGLTDEDMRREISTASLPGPDVQTIGQVLERMRNTYCRSIGVQFMHIDSLVVRLWLQERMETSENHIALSRTQQLRILRRLTEAVKFEEFIQKKYIGAKSFSLEGGESLIPLLDMAFERAGDQGIEEVVLGMAHRGRLNVLANIMNKRPEEIFREFEDAHDESMEGSGDVKYHLGYSTDWRTGSGRSIHISLSFNPSHLEFINPVIVGRVRAKQDRVRDAKRRRGLALVIHGDSAFAGEGVVQETLNMSQLDGYAVGGTLHVIVNNQIGFTTPPSQARTTFYATNIAKMLQAPIFHVNGEDPEAVAQAIHLAMDFRERFQRDVFIDMYCYRRRGHNEGDEPSFTQPVLYRAIEQRKAVWEGYLDRLLEMGGVTRGEADDMAERLSHRLETALEEAKKEPRKRRPDVLKGIWTGYRGGRDAETPLPDTGIEEQRLAALLERLTVVPDGFHLHPKLAKVFERRLEMARGERPLDWAAAEALAFASLATEGIRVRMTGQDSERGTFSQRHAMLHDTEDGHTYMPLQHLAENQAPVDIINSPLNETGVLGFEYGYSLDCPDGLVLWEAQFGDFCNAAQVIIDQFITSAEDKWQRLSGITLLLPHGFEGQGPEHSSARLERWLVLSAEDNIQVVLPTTPAQYFHLLRRQIIRPYRKPLVVLTPKSLLRHAKVVSDLDELVTGRFRRVIPDEKVKSNASRVLVCTGKMYYDLLEKREQVGRDDLAIIRIEQLYPLPVEELQAATQGYADGTPVVWVQEEPRNMGAWPYLKLNLKGKLFGRLPIRAIYRHESPSPATGSHSAHKMEQERLLVEAMAVK